MKLNHDRIEQHSVRTWVSCTCLQVQRSGVHDCFISSLAFILFPISRFTIKVNELQYQSLPFAPSKPLYIFKICSHRSSIFIKDGLRNLICVFFFFLVFLGLHPQHMEAPRLEVKSELQLLGYTTAHGNARSLTH